MEIHNINFINQIPISYNTSQVTMCLAMASGVAARTPSEECIWKLKRRVQRGRNCFRIGTTRSELSKETDYCREQRSHALTRDVWNQKLGVARCGVSNGF
jgi:hypothetical protein